MTSRLQIVRYQMGYVVDTVMSVLDRAILMIPADQLDFRPTPESMSAKELAYHVYQVAFILTRGAEKGVFAGSDFNLVPFDPDQVTSPSDIVDYGRRVKIYLRQAVAGFTDVNLDRTVHYYFGQRLTGMESMARVVEETIHHRGQLMLYLRLMGVTPPGLYRYE